MAKCVYIRRMSSQRKRKAREPTPGPRKQVRKEDWVRIRVSLADKGLLQQAASRVGLGVSAFMLSAALEKARASLGT